MQPKKRWSLNSGHVISQRTIAYFSQNPLSPKKNDDGQKNTRKEGKQTLKGIPFEVCFSVKTVRDFVKYRHKKFDDVDNV